MAPLQANQFRRPTLLSDFLGVPLKRSRYPMAPCAPFFEGTMERAALIAIGGTMSDLNPLSWILNSLKVWPEPVSIPDLSELTPVEIAEIRSRLQAFAQVATELRRLVDEGLAGALQGSALRYGDDILRANNGNGSAKVKDDNVWWSQVVEGLKGTAKPELLLEALYPASAVRITALPKLASVLGENPDDFKASHIVYDPATSPLSVMPISRAPKFLQSLEEGEIR